MSVLSSLASRHTDLGSGAIDHLHRLLREWQVLSDLAFGDCLLFAPTRDRSGLVVLAQVRPYPAQTLYAEDMVGTVVPVRARPQVAQALAERRIVRESDPEWREGVPVREETVPVMLGGEPVGVITVEQNLAAARTPSRLELAYMRAAGDLQQMIAEGTFPFTEEPPERELSPRVGDGFLQVDADWLVTYASPNAISSYRRLGYGGNVIGERIGDLGIDERSMLAVLGSRRPFENEVEANGAWVLRRFIPVVHGRSVKGAIGLLRDITESRRRDRMLSIKDATIREIHHRVKNNLQTVASLLRLQARRLGTSEARAELEQSVRRISSIALVHETLSREATEHVAFDEVAQRIVQMTLEGLSAPSRPVAFSVQGSAGRLPSDLATPLSLVLAELIQNAVEHAFGTAGGTVVVSLKRDDAIRLEVRDDGAGLPDGFSAARDGNLGLQIVRALVEELGGSMTLRSEGGTVAAVSVPVDS